MLVAIISPRHHISNLRPSILHPNPQARSPGTSTFDPRTVVAVSGDVDVITDGSTVVKVKNGTPMLTKYWPQP